MEETGCKERVTLGDLAALRERLARRTDRRGGEDACWPWLGSTNKGYGRLKLGGGRFILTHRLALMLDGRWPGPGQVARHRCNEPLCCNPRHLAWGTQIENVADRQRAGRQARGEDNGRARLTRRDVLAIRAAPRGRGQLSALARQYGVHVTTIRAILERRSWRDV